jgi:type I restriction enzyme R subunit
MPSEAQARIKINRMLEESGWRFFDDHTGPANIQLEHNVKLSQKSIDDLGDNFEKLSTGFVDFLLLDPQGIPLVVLEAKSESVDPLVGKEQARVYARSLNTRFIILSNGNLHYFWDTEHGNPSIITRFSKQSEISEYHKFKPDPVRIVQTLVEADYIALAQLPNYANQAGWNNPLEQPNFIKANRLRFLREYQIRAIRSIQTSLREGNNRFLLEMATGTGKTLTAAALIKLFLATGNARRVLFLVDRIELENQAKKAFDACLRNDFTTHIYKENRDDWRRAEIVVSTVQSLLHNNKFERLFAPTDFDLIISDESHRSIGGNARAVFEYFVGYKLGLTATPKDYLKNYESDETTTTDPRDHERRLLLDTYRTFGCDSGQPTFRYSLLDGVKDGHLISPTVIDARTKITTQLLSEEGYAAVPIAQENQEETEQTYTSTDFEKKFFSEPTNRLFCQTLLKNGLRDPVTGEFGKTLVFAVSQKHAGKITQILNELANLIWPGKYQSDFAIQVTSSIPQAQDFTSLFTYNSLRGKGNFNAAYHTSKTRVCVTVGMMTTGYDCPDILNLALLRPIFSPSEFIQIKGRGTRKHSFTEELHDENLKSLIHNPHKTAYKLFDFFANCEYFENEFNYDEVIELPVEPSSGSIGGDANPPRRTGFYKNVLPDLIATFQEQTIGLEGMKIDRMFYQRVEDQVQADTEIRDHVMAGEWDQAKDLVIHRHFDKPNDFASLDKLQIAIGMDRKITIQEFLEKTFGIIPEYKTKDQLVNDSFDQFLLTFQLEPAAQQNLASIRHYFKAYITDNRLRQIIEEKRFGELNTNPSFGMAEFMALPANIRQAIPIYVKNYVMLNKFL